MSKPNPERLAVRLASRCVWTISEVFVRSSLKRIHCPICESDDRYILRSLASEKSLPLGLLSFASLFRATGRLPKIELLVDDSISATEVENYYLQGGIPVRAIGFAELLSSHAISASFNCIEFAKALFFGRKLVFTFGMPSTEPVLYADLDVLWFRDPFPIFFEDQTKELVASTDCYRSYDRGVLEVIESSHRELLENVPPVCAGLFGYQNSLKLPPILEKYLGAMPFGN